METSGNRRRVPECALFIFSVWLLRRTLIKWYICNGNISCAVGVSNLTKRPYWHQNARVVPESCLLSLLRGQARACQWMIRIWLVKRRDDPVVGSVFCVSYRYCAVPNCRLQSFINWRFSQFNYYWDYGLRIRRWCTVLGPFILGQICILWVLACYKWLAVL
jgi:hypothetical protein